MSLSVRLWAFEPEEFARAVYALAPSEKAEQYRKWLPAAAAGAVQEVMSILSLPRDHLWHICGGVFGYPNDSGPRFTIMCFSGAFDLVESTFDGRADPQEQGTELFEVWGRPDRLEHRTWHDLLGAKWAMRRFQRAMYTHWLLGGGFDAPKYFMPAWLVPKEVP